MRDRMHFAAKSKLNVSHVYFGRDCTVTCCVVCDVRGSAKTCLLAFCRLVTHLCLHSALLKFLEAVSSLHCILLTLRRIILSLLTFESPQHHKQAGFISASILCNLVHDIRHIYCVLLGTLRDGCWRTFRRQDHHLRHVHHETRYYSQNKPSQMILQLSY